MTVFCAVLLWVVVVLISGDFVVMTALCGSYILGLLIGSMGCRK